MAALLLAADSLLLCPSLVVFPFFCRYNLRNRMLNARKAMESTARPPITPPMMAPTLLLELEFDVLEFDLVVDVGLD